MSGGANQGDSMTMMTYHVTRLGKVDDSLLGHSVRHCATQGPCSADTVSIVARNDDPLHVQQGDRITVQPAGYDVYGAPVERIVRVDRIDGSHQETELSVRPI